MPLTASTKTSPARSTLSSVTRSLSMSCCSFSTTDAYGLNIPVMSRMSTLHSLNDKSLRLPIDQHCIKRKIGSKERHECRRFHLNIMIRLPHERLHIKSHVFVIQCSAQTTLEVLDYFVLVRIVFAFKLLFHHTIEKWFGKRIFMDGIGAKWTNEIEKWWSAKTIVICKILRLKFVANASRNCRPKKNHKIDDHYCCWSRWKQIIKS